MKRVLKVFTNEHEKKKGTLFPKKSEKRFTRTLQTHKQHDAGIKDHPQSIRGWQIWGLWCFFGVVLAYQLFFSGVFVVTHIEVVGTGLLTEDEVRSMVSDKLTGKNILAIPHANLLVLSSQRLEDELTRTLPLVRRITVTRIFPNTLEVSLLERGELVFWCSHAEQCALIDEAGVIIDRPSALNEQRVARFFLMDESRKEYAVGDRVTDETLLQYLRGFSQALSEQLDIAIHDQVFIPSKYADEVRFEMESGVEILAHTSIPVEKTVNTIRIVLEKAIPHERLTDLVRIDVRVSDKAFYRLRDEIPEEVFVEDQERELPGE